MLIIMIVSFWFGMLFATHHMWNGLIHIWHANHNPCLSMGLDHTSHETKSYVTLTKFVLNFLT